MSSVKINAVMSYELWGHAISRGLIMSYEYEGAHNYEAPHNPKTHNRGEPWY